MATWDKICRVCASPAHYEVFSKIPAYLHSSSNEFINWQKPINILIEETSGLKVTQDDGLPSSICAVCISYLKHAVTFRDQVIRNSLSLQAVKKLRDEKTHMDDKSSLLITEKDLYFSPSRKLNTNMLVNATQNEKDAKVCKKRLFQQPSAAPSQDYIKQQMRYVNLLFDKDMNAGIAELDRQCETEAVASRPYADPMADYDTESTSNEDDIINSSNLTKESIFSYKEKNFEEDDIMNLDELRDAINVTIPETFKERKCRACFRRFMFEDSYEQHKEDCIEYRFLSFTEDINLLLDIRRKKAVSPHEFIRRMIFCIRKICDFLKINCDEVMLPDDLGINNEKTLQNQDYKSDEKEDLDKTILNEHDSPVNFTDGNDKEPTNYNLNELLLDRSQEVNRCLGTTPPISIHNNILYEIERAQSVCSDTILNNVEDDKHKYINVPDNNNVKLMRPIPMHATPKSQSIQQPQIILRPQVTPTKVTDNDRLTFMQKLEQISVCQTPQREPNQCPPTTSISVRKDLMPKTKIVPASPQYCSAVCNMCNAIFETIRDFELHNAMYHNVAVVETHAEVGRERRNSEEERERIIAMFENEDEM